jgi:hypothetical protein
LKYFDGTPTALQVEERKKTRRMKTMSEAMDKKKEHVSLMLYMQRSVPVG